MRTVRRDFRFLKRINLLTNNYSDLLGYSNYLSILLLPNYSMIYSISNNNNANDSREILEKAKICRNKKDRKKFRS